MFLQTNQSIVRTKPDDNYIHGKNNNEMYITEYTATY